MRNTGLPLIVLGLGLCTLGFTTNKTFMFAGLAFVFVGIVTMLREGRR